MADIQPTIDLIDGALRDYISPDAMRWVPEDERDDPQSLAVGGGVDHGTPLLPERMWDDCVCNLTPTHLSVNGVDLSEYVRSIDLNPMVSDVTAFGDSGWRETIGGLRSGSMPLSFEWGAATTEDPSYCRTGDDWAAVNPTASSRVSDWIAENLPEMPIVSSPFVPEGQIWMVNQPQPSRVWFESETMDYDGDAATWRIRTHWMPPLRNGDLVVFGGNYYLCREHLPVRTRRPSAGYTAPRDNPRITALHKAYRIRSLARRRRNR